MHHQILWYVVNYYTLPSRYNKTFNYDFEVLKFKTFRAIWAQFL